VIQKAQTYPTPDIRRKSFYILNLNVGLPSDITRHKGPPTILMSGNVGSLPDIQDTTNKALTPYVGCRVLARAEKSNEVG
jgi:hypothetical protein